jgi:hypothetical protein
MRNTLKVTVYSRFTEITAMLPARWVVCPACQGCGTDRGASVECDGGGFTASEWNEQDEEFREDYMAGRYDRECNVCHGRTTVQQIDEEACTGWRNRIILKALCEQTQDSYDIDAEMRAERRMGA